jgi:hypothetical protein
MNGLKERASSSKKSKSEVKLALNGSFNADNFGSPFPSKEKEDGKLKKGK